MVEGDSSADRHCCCLASHRAESPEDQWTPKGNEKDVDHLLLKSGSETFDVYLCPKAFLDDMGVSFSKGDEIALTGSRVKQGEGEWILAREVVRGTDTLVLRDAKGNPVWS